MKDSERLIDFLKEFDFSMDLNGCYFHYFTKDPDSDEIFDLHVCKTILNQKFQSKDYYLISRHNIYDITYGIQANLSAFYWSSPIWRKPLDNNKFAEPVFFDSKEQLILKLENLIYIG